MIGTLREELQVTGAIVSSDGEGLRVKASGIASLARAVRALRARKLAIRVRGTGDGEGIAASTAAIVDIAALDRIVAVDGLTGIARVEAGCRVDALEEAVRKASSTLGPLLPSVLSGSVGAWLCGPTRGERGIPGARRETAALAVASVLADGRIAESRAAPRSATGPDLDHLALGGEGRLCIVAAAVVRLFPRAPSCSLALRAPSVAEAVDAVARLCRDRLEPARGIVRGSDGAVILALSWEGPETARLHRDRAARALADRRWPPAPEMDPDEAFRSPASSAGIEVDASWEATASLARKGGECALELVGLHAGGAFAVLESAGQTAEMCAGAAREAGARVIAPGRLRDEVPGWKEMGASAAWQRLAAALWNEPGPDAPPAAGSGAPEHPTAEGQ